MGMAEQRAKDSAMAANLREGDGRPDRVAARKRTRSESLLRSILHGGPGTARYRRYLERASRSNRAAA